MAKSSGKKKSATNSKTTAKQNAAKRTRGQKPGTQNQSPLAAQAQLLVREKQFTELGNLITSVDCLDASEPGIAEAFVVLPFSEDISLVKTFLDRGVPINTQHKSLGILHVAVKLPNADFVRQIIEFGANVRLRDDIEQTVFVHCINAAAKCHGERECLLPNYLEIAQSLLDAGADINEATPDGITPLDFACYRRRSQVPEWLIKKGADISKCYQNGSIAFWEALQAPDDKLLALLLRLGANIKSQINDKGELPLMENAVKRGCVDKVKLLIEAGAPATLADGRDAIQAAQDRAGLWDKVREQFGFGQRLPGKSNAVPEQRMD